MKDDIKIAFLGDIVPGGILHYQKNFVTNELLNFLSTFDIRIGTLESPLGDNLRFDQKKMSGRMNIIYSMSSDITKLIELGINVVSLSNNHIFDLGLEGFEHTIKLLKQNGIKYCGAGMNIADASEPAVVNYKGKKIAFIATCDYDPLHIGHIPKATNTSAGVNILDIDRICSSIKLACKSNDYVFIIPHWGIEYSFFPTYRMLQSATAMINAGANGIIGGHPHQIQPFINYKKAPIYFSLGNTFFPDFYIQPPRPISYPQTKAEVERHRKIYHDYPYPALKPGKRGWKKRGRIGMIVEFIISNQLETKYRLVINNKDNIFDLYHSFKYRILLYCIGLFMRTPIYRGEEKYRAFMKKSKKLIKFFLIIRN